MHKLLKQTLAAVTLLGLATTVVAYPGKSRGMGPDEGFGFLEMVADHIGITEEQEDSINELIDAAQLASAVDRERMSQIREALRELTETGEVFDESGASLLAQELAEIIARTTVAGLEVRWQVRQVLTAEQRAQLAALREDRVGKRFPGRRAETE